MQDRPSAPELLESVAEYLAGELRAEAPAGQRFKLLVAANVCAVVARELRAGGEPDAADSALFRRLLGDAAEPPDATTEELAAALARRVRAGELDGQVPALVDALRAHIARKLAVARPGYDGAGL